MALTNRPLERNFGHCRVLWNIKNFSLVICKPNNLLTSEEFSITSIKVTRWMLGFSLQDDGHKIKLFLQRLSDDYEESVSISWRVTMLDSKGEGTFIADTQSVLPQNSYCHVDSSAPLNVLRVLTTGEPNEVSIVYEIIVLLNIPMVIASPHDKILGTLIKDFAGMYESGLHSTIAVTCNETTLNMHKAMLFPRSAKLADRAGSTGKKIQLYYTDILAVKRVFAYLYTGNLSYIFNPPMISVNEYIRDLDIKELRNSYPQEKISMKTVANSKLFEFHWIIPNFSNLEDVQDSSVYEADGMRTRWQLRVFPEALPEDSSRQKKYVYFEALQLNDVSSLDVYVDIKAIKKDGRTVVAKRSHATVEKGSKLGVIFMRLGGYAMTEALIESSLHVTFCVNEATGQLDTETTDIQAPLPFNLNNHDTFTILTNYLGLLQVNHAYSDIVLNVGNHYFRSHKFILAGRSPDFSEKLLTVSEEDKCLDLTFSNKHAFRVFLDFIYTANVTDVDVNVMRELYDYSCKCKVLTLAKCCLVHIRQQISPENIWNILCFAHERIITSLKTTTLHFVFHMRDEVFHNDGWQDLKRKHPRLSKEILEFVEANKPRASSTLIDIIPEDPELDMEEDEPIYPYSYNIEHT